MVENSTSNTVRLNFQQKIYLLGIYALLGFFSILPLRWTRALGKALGNLYYALDKKRVHVSRTNLKICYPHLSESEREAIVKKNIQSAGMWFFESGAIWLWPGEKILSKVELENFQLFEKVLAENKGMILAIPHIGNWEVMGPLTSKYSEFACFYQHEASTPVFDEFIRRRRIRNGTIMAPANSVGIRRLYKHLRTGKVAGLLPDHLPSEEMGVYAPFFGRPAFTGTLLSSLAKKNNVPVIASAVIRTENGFKVTFIEVERQQDDDPEVAATALNQAIEKCVALAPEQFQWVYPRFRKHPDSENFPSPYR